MTTRTKKYTQDLAFLAIAVKAVLICYFWYRVRSSKWIDSSSQEYNAVLRLSGIDRKGLVNEVTKLISNNMSVDINKINFDSEDSFFTGVIHVSVLNKNVLIKLVQNLSRVNGIDKIIRE